MDKATEKEDYVKFIESSKYFKDFDAFKAEHPEVGPEWEEFVEPRMQKVERDMLAFVFGLF